MWTNETAETIGAARTITRSQGKPYNYSTAYLPPRCFAGFIAQLVDKGLRGKPVAKAPKG